MMIKFFGDNGDIVIERIAKAQHMELSAFSTMHENKHKTMQSKVSQGDEGLYQQTNAV